MQFSLSAEKWDDAYCEQGKIFSSVIFKFLTDRTIAKIDTSKKMTQVSFINMQFCGNNVKYLIGTQIVKQICICPRDPKLGKEKR